MISFSPSVRATWNNSSSSFNIIAFIPLVLMFSKADTSVFLIKPFLVANTKNPTLSSFGLTFNTAARVSPSWKFNKLTIGKPFARRPA